MFVDDPTQLIGNDFQHHTHTNTRTHTCARTYGRVSEIQWNKKKSEGDPKQKTLMVPSGTITAMCLKKHRCTVSCSLQIQKIKVSRANLKARNHRSELKSIKTTT